MRGDGYVENYLPVYDEEAGVRRLVAVVELYRNQAVLFAAIRDGRRLVWAGSVAGGLFLFATLIWFVRRAERALREQQGRLVEAEALAIVGEVSAAVAHSIRNPLGSIRSTAELQLELGADRAATGRDHARCRPRRGAGQQLLTYAADPTEHAASADLDTVIAAAQSRSRPNSARQGKPFELDRAGGRSAASTPTGADGAGARSLLDQCRRGHACRRGIRLRSVPRGRAAPCRSQRHGRRHRAKPH